METTTLTTEEKDEVIAALLSRNAQLEYQLNFALNALKQVEAEEPEVFVSPAYQSFCESYRLLWN